MKRKRIIIIVILLFAIVLVYYLTHVRHTVFSGKKNADYCLPRVAFIASGTNDGNGMLPSGVIVALQTFNKEGVYTKIVSRDILFSADDMEAFNIIVIPTAAEYYDIDRKYSLTFMSDAELINLREWVKNGGVLIAGDNAGRNMPDGSDRANVFGKLTPDNWALGECFGVSLQERNLRNFRIEGKITDSLRGIFIPTCTTEQWSLVVDSVHSTQLKSLASWTDNGRSYPALIQNRFGKGISFLLPTSYFLHPANNSGLWGAKQIASFYKYILGQFYASHQNKVSLNPWPSACEHAFCITLNAAGERKEYELLLSYLNNEGITASIFVDGNVKGDLKDFLSSKKINLESNGFKKMNYREHDFAAIKGDILENINYWDRNFKGFRFPYTRNTGAGIMVLNDIGYTFDSSIGADNIGDFYGSVVPYNLPVSVAPYYRISEVLEIAPALHDDYYFYKNFYSDSTGTEQQEKASRLFEKYLLNYWEYGVKPYNGAFVFMGHALYTGKSELALLPLKNLVRKVKEDNAWITTIEEIANFRDKLGKLRFRVTESGDQLEIDVIAPKGIELENTTLKFEREPHAIKIAKGDYKLTHKHGAYYLSFNAYNGQHIKLEL